MTQADFDAWSRTPASRSAGSGGGGGRRRGEAIFNSNGCGACHTFSAIPTAEGKIGPDLDNLKQQAAKAAGEPLEDFIRESIVDPNA